MSAPKPHGSRRTRDAGLRPPRAPEGDAERPSSDDRPETLSWWDAFYRVVRRIPAGRVTTYGIVAELAGRPRAARHVGFALAALKGTRTHLDVPWHRVLGSRSRRRAGVSIHDPTSGALQRMLLEREGVQFDERGNVALDRFGWFGAEPASPSPAQKRRGSGPGRARKHKGA